MKLRFTKMQGLGNDFVVIDALRQTVRLDRDRVRRLADRHFGVGCDQVLVVERPAKPGVDFRYRIFNSDGDEVEQCGNGARCFARYVRDEGLIDEDEIVVETAGGIISLFVEADGQVSVDMGRPRLAPAAIPFEAPLQAVTYPIQVDGLDLEVGAVSMGNPHCVLTVADVDQAPVDTLGPALERHPRFPRRVNVGFMQVRDRRHIRLRVFERGAGETLACGSGACAAVVAGRLQGLLDGVVRVDLPGGSLHIQWHEGQPVLLTGPAVRVFEGEITL